jgi:luciferase family oxidoreductase group 1
VPLNILGSSLFGAQLAAALGLPYCFASHFAPAALQEAVSTYRREFRPSVQLAEPYVMAGVNVIAADTGEEAQEQFRAAQRRRVSALLGRGGTFTDDEADLLLDSPAGQQVLQMSIYSAVGTPAEVKEYLEEFIPHAGADELIVAGQSPTAATRLRSFELLAHVMGLADR